MTTPNNGFTFTPGGASWTFSGDSGIQRNGGFLSTTDSPPPNAPDGSQTAFIESYPGTTTGSVSQSLTFPYAGTYTLSFMAWGWRGTYEPLQLSIDGVAVGGSLTIPTSSFGQVTTAVFTIPISGTHTITLAGAYTGDLKVSLVDKVTINLISIQDPSFVNGSFETPNVASYGGFAFRPTGSGWTFAGDSGIQSNGGFLAQNDPSLPNAPDGVQTAFIESYPGTTTGSVSQSLNFPNAGTYSISFLASGWRGSSEPLQLIVDSVAIPGIFTPPADSYSPFMTADFTITAPGSHTITLAGTSTGDFKVSLVDKVTITHYLVTATSTVPDPTWDPAHPRFFSGTNCASTATALAITGHVTHVQLLVGGILVKEYDDTATTPLTTDPSVILSTGTNLTSTNLTVNFDSTHFADSTSIPIQMNVQDSGGTADNYSYQIAANAYNKGYDGGGSGNSSNNQTLHGSEAASFIQGQYLSAGITPTLGPNDSKATTLNQIPIFCDFFSYTHGLENTNDTLRVWFAATDNKVDNFGNDYLIYGSSSTAPSTPPQTGVSEAVANKSQFQPPYNLVFLDSCNSAYEADLASGFGITTLTVPDDDRAFLGWLTKVEDSLLNADWADYVYQQLQNGRTLQQSVDDANQAYLLTPLHQSTLSSAAAMYQIFGDPDMTLHGTVRGGVQHHWFK